MIKYWYYSSRGSDILSIDINGKAEIGIFYDDYFDFNKRRSYKYYNRESIVSKRDGAVEIDLQDIYDHVNKKAFHRNVFRSVFED